jgi:hypothetical protein
MITAETLDSLTTYSPEFLTRAVQNAGYKDTKFTSCKFLGITNGGQFCYMGVYPVKGGVDSTKVFLTYNHAEDKVTADTDLTNW